MMDEVLHDCLYPVMLGSGVQCHALVRQMQREYGIGSTVLTGKRALTLRFLPSVKLIAAAPALPDELLLSILRDVEHEGGARIPLLVLCDEAYRDFWMRNSEQLRARFILRRAEELLEGRYK
jgi:hypothetical protein